MFIFGFEYIKDPCFNCNYVSRNYIKEDLHSEIRTYIILRCASKIRKFFCVRKFLNIKEK